MLQTASDVKFRTCSEDLGHQPDMKHLVLNHLLDDFLKLVILRLSMGIIKSYKGFHEAFSYEGWRD